MDDIIEGIIKLAIGGLICAVFGSLLVQSLYNKRARSEFLSSPHVRNPTLLHKIGFATLALALVTFGGMLVWSGMAKLTG